MYVTIDEYRRKGYKSASEMTDEQIEEYILSASGIVDEYCNTKFEPTKDKCFLDFARKFYVPKAPLLRISNLSVAGVKKAEDVDFFVYNDERIIELSSDLAKPKQLRKSISLLYYYGYNTTPETVKDVICELVDFEYSLRISGLTGSIIQTESFDTEYSYQLQVGKELTPQARRESILARLDKFVVCNINDLEPLELSDGSVKVRIL